MNIVSLRKTNFDLDEKKYDNKPKTLLYQGKIYELK